MFKATVENGECTVETAGSIIQIATDVSRVAGAIYEGIKKADPIEAEFFKIGMITAMKEESPVWGLKQESKDAIVKNAIVIATPNKNKKGDAPTGQSQGTASE